MDRDEEQARRVELRKFLAMCRARCDPGDLALPDGFGLERRDGRGRRARGVTHEMLAFKLGRSLSSWMLYATGQLEMPEPDVERVVDILGLSEAERARLYVLGRRRPAPPSLRPSTHDALRASGWWDHVLQQRWPTCLVDGHWQVSVVNDAYERLFPAWAMAAARGQERNLMRWVLLHKEPEAVLADFWGTWAPEMISQLHTVRQLHPEDPILRALVEQISTAPRMRRLWAQITDSAYVPASQGRVYRLNHPDCGQETEIQPLISTLDEFALHHLITLQPAKPHRCSTTGPTTNTQ